MPRKTKEIVLAAALALMCLGNILFVGGTVATVFGVFGVMFFGGGAALLFFRPQGLQSTRRTKPSAVRARPTRPATSPVIATLKAADKAAALAHGAVFQQFGVLADGVVEADWFQHACADAVTPGRPLTPDDVLSAFDELAYYEPNLARSDVAPNLARIGLESEGDLDDVVKQLAVLAGLIESDVQVSTELAGDQVQLRVGERSATVDLGSILNEGRRSGYYIAAYVALAELYRRNRTGYRLALVAADFSGYVLRIPEGSVDQLNVELGLTRNHYNWLVWLDLPSNDLDDMRSVVFEST